MFENIKNEEQAIAIQNELNDFIELKSNLDHQSLKIIAGVDLAIGMKKTKNMRFAV